jgi:large subunit ribosomal protein L21
MTDVYIMPGPQSNSAKQAPVIPRAPRNGLNSRRFIRPAQCLPPFDVCSPCSSSFRNVDGHVAAIAAPRAAVVAASRGIATEASSVSTTADALAQLRLQPSHYVVASVAGKKYLLAPRDLLTVPRLRDVRVGDVLNLSSIHEVGSREYTLRGTPDIPAGTVQVSATVVEHTKGAMEFITKFKRRKGYKKVVMHKQPYTRLRIGPIDFASQVSPTHAPQ